MKRVQWIEVDENILQPVWNLYHRTEDSFREDVSRLEEWMKTQPHLPEVLGKRVIANFLLINKCSIEKAKQKIDMYYTIRTMIPDFYEHINPKLPDMVEMRNVLYWVVVPKLTKENFRVFFFKLHHKDFINNVEPLNVMRHCLNIQEIRLAEDYWLGDLAVFDLDGFTFSYMLKVTPMLLAKINTIAEEVFSAPIKGIYVLNCTPIVNTLLATLKSLIKPKIFERINFCEDTSLLKKLPKELIPRDYGGEGRSLEELNELLESKFVQYQERFDQLDNLRVDENLRPEKLKNDELLGFHGNFKQLNVD